MKIAELIGAASSMQIALAEAKSKLADKDAEISKLKENFNRAGELVQHTGYMYESGNDGKPVGAPYCPRCYTADGMLFRTTQTIKPGHPFECPECRREYQVSGFLYGDEVRQVDEVRQTSRPRYRD